MSKARISIDCVTETLEAATAMHNDAVETQLRAEVAIQAALPAWQGLDDASRAAALDWLGAALHLHESRRWLEARGRDVETLTRAVESARINVQQRRLPLIEWQFAMNVRELHAACPACVPPTYLHDLSAAMLREPPLPPPPDPPLTTPPRKMALAGLLQRLPPLRRRRRS